MDEEKNITAIILAGGKSSRMKEDKGLVNFNGKKLIEYVIEAVKKFTPNIMIVTSNAAYKQFGFLCIEDELKEKGPLGGILSGLTHSATNKNLLLGCDMPFLSKTILSAIIQNIGDEDVLLTEHNGKAEPLCSVYDRNCITHIRLRVEQNQLKVTDALERLKTRTISFDNEVWFKGNEFANINSFEEMKKYGSQ